MAEYCNNDNDNKQHTKTTMTKMYATKFTIKFIHNNFNTCKLYKY